MSLWEGEKMQGRRKFTVRWAGQRWALGRDERPERNMAMAMAMAGPGLEGSRAGGKSNFGQPGMMSAGQ